MGKRPINYTMKTPKKIKRSTTVDKAFKGNLSAVDNI